MLGLDAVLPTLCISVTCLTGVANKDFDVVDWRSQRIGKACAKTESLWREQWLAYQITTYGSISDFEVKLFSVGINSNRVWQCHKKGGKRTTNGWH